MKASAEVRWFRRGPLPDDVRAAFLAGTDAAAAGGAVERVDRYLVLPGADGVGVKVREGRLEVKARTGGPDLVELAPGFVGRLETWLKWNAGERGAAAVAAAPPGLPEVPDDYALLPDTWTEVRKRRLERKFVAAGDDDGVREIDPAPPFVAGCTVELVALEREGAPWWSLAFETSVRGGSRTFLGRVARAFLAAAALPVELDPAESRAYPEWLAGRSG